jgi:epoxyqueuosine reductase
MPEKRCTLGGLTMSDYSGKFTEELETFCRQKGADLFGIADLDPAIDFLASHGDPIATGYPRAVSIGMQINDTIVENHDPDEPRGKSLYWHHIYEVVSQSLNFVAYDVSRWLANYGWDALPVPASMPYNLKKRQGVISHKLPAHLAGLGWIGKNCLLLTSEFGPRVRFATVLTDAPLSEGVKKDKKCGKCTICIDTCPVNAFTGVEFSPSDDVDIRFDTAKCSEYRIKHPCGLCVSSCAIGKKYKWRFKSATVKKAV